MGLLDFINRFKVQTLYFENGNLKKISGIQDYWYDPDFIVSDGIRYDMSDPKIISSICCPHFENADPLKGYGSTGMLDYVLRMKAGVCFGRGEKVLCSALLWKSTEIMFENKMCNWRKSDYERLVDWHIQMGMDSEAAKAREFLSERGIILLNPRRSQSKKSTVCQNRPPKKAPEMTPQEKELFLVQQTTLSDMKELTSMPFVWNTDVQKQIKPGSHPFAYMDIIGENVQIAKSELEKMNLQIEQDARLYPQIPKNARIPIKDIVFRKSEMYGYTRIMCTPKTLTGKIAKHPLKLFFATDLSKTATGGNTTHGKLIYNKDGAVASANIYCWRRNGGFFFYYKTIDGVLTLQNVESKNIPR